MHDFKAKLGEGNAHEEWSREFYAQWWERKEYTIQTSEFLDRRLGIDDRWFDPMTGFEISIQYKFDQRSAETGNIFFETLSRDVGDVSSGLYTTDADIVAYMLPASSENAKDEVMLFDKQVLRSAVWGTWRHRYQEKQVENDGYMTLGIAVPKSVARPLAFYGWKGTFDRDVLFSMSEPPPVSSFVHVPPQPKYRTA